MVRFRITFLLPCLEMNKVHGWKMLPKCRAGLNYCLVVGPLFEKSSPPLPQPPPMFRFTITFLLPCFEMNKAHGWKMLPKCRAGLNYCLVVGPLFEKSSPPPTPHLCFRFTITFLLPCFEMNKPHGWKMLPKCKAGLNYCLVVRPLFEKSSPSPSPHPTPTYVLGSR
jgi:hypothetical protein